MIHKVANRLVSHLEKGKPSPFSPYLFHLYSRNECLKDEEIDEIEAARKYLEFGVSLETIMLSEEEGSEHRSPSLREWFRTAGTSSSGRLKHTYRSPKGSSKFRSQEWRTLVSSEDDPFWRVFDDLEQLCFQYLNLDTITTRASKLLGDCKVGNIEKELTKLKAVDTKALEDKISNLTVTLALRNDEIEDLRKQVKYFELLKQAIGAPGDVVNKARLFDEDVKSEGELSAAKIIKVLVSFIREVETALVEIRKVVSGTAVRESSRPPRPPPTDTPHKEKPLSKVKIPLPQ